MEKTPEKSQNSIIALEKILSDQVTMYQRVEEKMQHKRRMIIEGNPNQLASVDQELVGLGHQIVMLEKQRMDLLTRMGQQDKTLKEIINAVTAESHQRSNLIDLRTRLKKSMENVRDINGQTRTLLDSSISWVESTVAQIAKALVPSATSYSQKGKLPNKGGLPDNISSTTIEREA